MATAVALCGAVIVSQDGRRMVYRKKCDACGHVEPGTTSSSIPTGTLSSSFYCSKCRTRQEISIQGERAATASPQPDGRENRTSHAESRSGSGAATSHPCSPGGGSFSSGGGGGGGGGAALLLLGAFLCLLPSTLAVWLFGGGTFTHAIEVVVGSPWGWFWSGIFWAVVLVPTRSKGLILAPLAVTGIAFVVVVYGWIVYVRTPVSERPFKAVQTLPVERGVSCASFSPNGKNALLGDWDGTLRLWDVQGWREVRRLKSKDKTGEVTCAAFSPDGTLAASGTGSPTSGYGDNAVDGYVLLWDLASGTETCCVKGRSGLVLAVKFSSDGKKLFAAGYWNTSFAVRLFDVPSGSELPSLKWSGRDVKKVAFSPDCSQLLLIAVESDK
jgi:WD40 repeat protein